MSIQSKVRYVSEESSPVHATKIRYDTETLYFNTFNLSDKVKVGVARLIK